MSSLDTLDLADNAQPDSPPSSGDGDLTLCPLGKQAKPTTDAPPPKSSTRQRGGGDRRGRWVEGVVDSGAVNSVARRGTFPGQVTPSAMSLAGKKYKCASSNTIANEGELGVRFLSGEGHQCAFKVQIAEVERPLISTADLAEAGNIVTVVGLGMGRRL